MTNVHRYTISISLSEYLLQHFNSNSVMYHSYIISHALEISPFYKVHKYCWNLIIFNISALPTTRNFYVHIVTLYHSLLMIFSISLPHQKEFFNYSSYFYLHFALAIPVLEQSQYLCLRVDLVDFLLGCWVVKACSSLRHYGALIELGL